MMRIASALLFVSQATADVPVTEDLVSLLQTKTTVTELSNDDGAKIISLDGVMEGPPPDCEPAKRMDLGKATVAYSNLGRQGPDVDSPEGILFENVLPDSGKKINLHMSAVSEYTAKKVKSNGLFSNFGRVNLMTGTDVTLEFEFQDGDTNAPIVMDPFTITFVDLDEQKENGYGRETITTSDEHEYILSSSSTVHAVRENGVTVFSSSEQGVGADNPRHAMMLTQPQKDKSVQLVFPSVSMFTVTLGAGAIPPHWSTSSRNILFAGQTNVYCPPDGPLPAAAPCSSMACPAGFMLKKKKKLEGVFCATDTCGGDDTWTCCQPDLCSPQRKLTFHGTSLLRNNLGNQGPGTGEEGMLFEDVFPKSDKKINLLVTANSGYQRKQDRLNGVRNKIGRINLVDGGNASLKFTFLSATHNTPTDVGPFYMSFLDFDEQQAEGKAREYITLDTFKKFELSDTTVVRSVKSNARGSAVTFHSTTFGNGDDNAENPHALTQGQMDKSISVVIPRVSSFDVGFHVGALPDGDSTRYIQFAGPTNLVC